MLGAMRRLTWLILLAACQSSTSQVPERTPEQEEKYKEAVARGEVKIGMTKGEVRAAIGPPKRTKKSMYRGRNATVWSYLYTDIFFDENGYVLGWQSAVG